MIRLGCTNPRRQVALASKFCIAVPHFWVRPMKLHSCNLLGAENFGMARRFFEN